MIAAHPSALALDLAALGHAPAEVTSHLLGCERCRAQVQTSAPLPPGPVPAWATRPPRRPAPWAWSLLAATCAAGVIGVLALRSSTGDEASDGTRPKGFPSFSVYVEHRGEVRLWDGRSPVSAGDRLQLKLAAAGFSHLVVGALDRGTWKVVHQGPVSATGESTLPRSFRVEPDDPAVLLGLLLCDRPCPPDALEDAARAAPRDAHRWWTALHLTRRDEP